MRFAIQRSDYDMFGNGYSKKKKTLKKQIKINRSSNYTNKPAKLTREPRIARPRAKKPKAYTSLQQQQNK